MSSQSSAAAEPALFTSASVILPAMNETDSLAKTVQLLLDLNGADIKELLIIVCDRTTPACLAAAETARHDHPDLVQIHHQVLPFLGGAVRDGFALARGSHVIMMASDLETDPRDVPILIAEAKKLPDAIITASRWRKGGGFEGYSRVKLLANWTFQKSFSALYATRLTDMTYGYRIFPTRLVQAIQWEEVRHPLLFETLIKPMRLGVKVVEIPSVWKVRHEGESQNTFFRNFEYFKTGLRARFRKRATILRPGQTI